MTRRRRFTCLEPGCEADTGDRERPFCRPHERARKAPGGPDDHPRTRLADDDAPDRTTPAERIAERAWERAQEDLRREDRDA